MFISSGIDETYLRESVDAQIHRNGDFIDIFFDGKWIGILTADLLTYLNSDNRGYADTIVTRDRPANINTLTHQFVKELEKINKSTL